MSADTAPASDVGPKAKIFISYSRKDMAFADRLEAALKARGFEPLIDRTEIYAFEDWWKRIETLIGRADTVVFVLSPDAVTSDVALKEVAYAASLNKRFAPIVCRRVEDGAVPEALRRLHFIFFDGPARFEASADQLAEALRTDIDWIRQHTEFGEAARRWAAAGRPGPRGLLLRSPVLEEAERWIASRPHGAPAPTFEAREFIAESRQAATRRRNILTAGLAAGMAVAFTLAGIAYWQRGIAESQRKIAESERKVAESRRIAMLAEMTRSQRLLGNFDTALRLGVHAVRLADDDMPTLRAALAAAVSQADWRLTLAGGESFNSVAFSPDGSRIVTASDDKTSSIWDATTGQAILVLRGHQDRVFSAAFKSDGTRIVTTSADKTARIWDAVSGKEIAILRHAESVSSGSFSRDGNRIVMVSTDNAVHIWSAKTATEIRTLRDPGSRVNSAAFSPDGTRIVTANGDPVTGEGNTAVIWDAITGKQVTVLRGHLSTVLDAAFNPDGTRIITASADKTARIWDAATGKEVMVLRHDDMVYSAAFSFDGTRIVTANDHTARIWDATTGHELAVLRGHEGIVRAAVFSPDGTRIVTVGRTTSVFLTAADEEDNSARIWVANPTEHLIILRGHQDAVYSAAFSPDGKRIVTASTDNTARIWDAFSGRETIALRGHEDKVYSAAFSPDGSRIVTASEDKTARIWDANSGREIIALRGHADPVRTAAFSPDGTRIVTASGEYPSTDATARIWNAATGSEMAVLRGHRERVASAAFSPDGGRIVTTSWDGTTRIWDAATGKQIIIIDAKDMGFSYMHAAAFSPDGKRIVIATDSHQVIICDATTGRQIMMLRAPESHVNSVAFSRDGRFIVAAVDIYMAVGQPGIANTARIWDAATGKEIADLPGHLNFVNDASFSPDGTRIATASSDGTARIWGDIDIAMMSAQDLVNEVCKRRLRGFTTLKPDEMRLAGYSSDVTRIDICAGIE